MTSSTDRLYWFRGQRDAGWNLETSLMRAIGDSELSLKEAATLEDDALKAFQSQAHLFVAPSLLDKVHTKPCWWALMQHHGAPTRLLDWSESPYVAAYFAAQPTRPETDGAVWCFCRQTLQTSFKANYGWPPDFLDQKAPGWFRDRLEKLREREIVMPLVFGYPSSQRIAAQQGCFTMCFKVRQKHDCVISQIEHECVRKLIIPAKKKADFLLRMRYMNITGSTLFPGTDGLGRSVWELVSLRAYSRMPVPAIALTGT